MSPLCRSLETAGMVSQPFDRLLIADNPPFPATVVKVGGKNKPASIKIRLNSSADTGFFYVTKKNARTKTEKLVMKKYDPIVRKHVEFKEGKIK